MDRNGPTYIISFVILICMIFGLGISVIYESTHEVLKKNEVLHRDKVLCNAFILSNDNTDKSYSQLVRENLKIEKIDNGTNLELKQVYKLINSESEKGSLGFDFIGMGFWDYIIGVIVLNHNLENIVNVQFFDQKETPGLGARIMEKEFTDQFKGLPIAWENPISRRVLIKPISGSKLKNQVDSITGATQTSMAVNHILNVELEKIRQLVLSYNFYND